MAGVIPPGVLMFSPLINLTLEEKCHSNVTTDLKSTNMEKLSPEPTQFRPPKTGIHPYNAVMPAHKSGRALREELELLSVAFSGCFALFTFENGLQRKLAAVIDLGDLDENLLANGENVFNVLNTLATCKLAHL